MKRGSGIFLWALVWLAAGPPVFAESHDLVDTTVARRQWFDRIIDPSRSDDYPRQDVITVPGTSGVEVRIDEQLGNRYYTFLRHSSPPAELTSPGAYIIRQRRSDGAIDQIKVFLQHDEGTFFRLRPRPSRRVLELDLYLAGSEFYRDVTVPISLERALRAPVSEIQRLTEGIIDWSMVNPDVDRREYSAIADMVERIRRDLPSLTDADDGAMAADGSIVFIDSLTPMEESPGFNCSGFAKWVVDGLYRPVTGSPIPIGLLREKHLNHRGTRWSQPVEDTRDPYFGLDWTRNLARVIHAVHTGVPMEEIDPEARDVRSAPTARYREDVGFPMDDLRGIMYWLAVMEPGMIYLGSVNRPVGEELVLRQHSHVVVIMPYFDQRGQFQPVVMERNVETSLDELIHRFEGAFIHLVRIDGTRSFDPPVTPR